MSGIFKFRSVSSAFYALMEMFQEEQKELDTMNFSKVETRNSTAIQLTGVAVIEYEDPLDRVLIAPIRDANPFFHLFEAIWMLDGSAELEPLLFFVKRFSTYSDDGIVLNGAYGHRWRFSESADLTNSIHIDQLELLINHLRTTPNSRRAVLQMWNVQDDLAKVSTSKDVCCNLSVVFQVNERNGVSNLDMTVFNRSNDVIWGTLGANFVHFSFLQEFIANSLELVVGRYYQVSCNLHCYTKTLTDTYETPEKLKEDEQIALAFKRKFNSVSMAENVVAASRTALPGKSWVISELYSIECIVIEGKYKSYDNCTIPEDISIVDSDLVNAINQHVEFGENIENCLEYEFSTKLFLPMMRLHFLWKLLSKQLKKNNRLISKKDVENLTIVLGSIQPIDWRFACYAWLKNRLNSLQNSRQDDGLQQSIEHFKSLNNIFEEGIYK